MTSSIVVLTEVALEADDAKRLAALHAEDNPHYQVLVPADPHRNLLADVLDHLSLLELREALDALRGHDDITPQDAQSAVEASVSALRAAGTSADGEVVGTDPVAALEEAGAKQAADEVIVVTSMHAVEDTFHTDWASKARERLGVPVLHVYAGTNRLG